MDAWREVVDVIGVTRYIANVTPRATRRRRHRGAMPVFTKTYEYRHPRGLVGFISPWNLPVHTLDQRRSRCAGDGQRGADQARRETPFRPCWGRVSSRRPGCRAMCCRS